MLTAIKMLMVFALLGGTLWYLRRHDRGALVNARRGDRPVAVVAQARVGKTASVAVVRIGGENWAVGVTEQSVSLLVPEPVELDALPGDGVDVTDDADGTSLTASAATARPAPPTVRAFVGNLLRRRRSVEYLDVDFATTRPARPSVASVAGVPAPARAADGSARTPSARMPEQSIPR